MKSSNYLMVVVILAAAALSSSASGASLTLSTHSSDATPASDLDATLDFIVVDDELTLVVSNLTDGPDEGADNGFDMNQVFFNAAANITGLVPLGDLGWALSTDAKGDGFGVFVVPAGL